MGVMTGGTTFLEGRMDRCHSCGEIVMTAEAELLACRRQHVRFGSGMGIMAADTIPVSDRRMENLLAITRIIMTGQTEVHTGCWQHHRCRSGMRAVTGGTTILQRRMDRIHPLGLAGVTHIAKGCPFLIKEEIQIALMRGMTANAAILKGRVNRSQPLNHALMAHIAECGAFFRKLEGVLLAGMLLGGPFMADQAFLSGNRSMDKFRLPHDGMALSGHTTLSSQQIGATAQQQQQNQKTPDKTRHHNTPLRRKN